MPKYLSGRQKLRPSNKLTEDRYQYLGLDQAEPNLADPLTSPGVPGGTQYQLVAVAGYDGRRYWVPIGGSLQPGRVYLQTSVPHGLQANDTISIADYSLIFTCTMDNRNTEHPYPRPTDPASTSNSQLSNGVLSLTTQGVDGIIVNVGESASGGYFAPLEMELIASILENSTSYYAKVS